MRTNYIKKGVVAVAAIFGLLLAMASPASADTVAHMDITGGTLSAAGQTFDLNPDEGPQGPCDIPDATVTVDFNPNSPASSGTWTISGSWKSQFQLGTPPSGPWYQADFSIAAGGGTWVHNSPSSTSTLASSAPNHVIFQVRIYQVDNGGTCAKDLAKCTMTVRVAFTGTWTSTTAAVLPDVAIGDTAVLNGSSVAPQHIVVSNCSAPFTAFAGQPATISGLTLETHSTTP